MNLHPCAFLIAIARGDWNLRFSEDTLFAHVVTAHPHYAGLRPCVNPTATIALFRTSVFVLIERIRVLFARSQPVFAAVDNVDVERTKDGDAGADDGGKNLS